MAGRDDITKYSETPLDNQDINNLNIAEFCPIANLNNAIRSLMSHLAALDKGTVTLTIPTATTVKATNLDLGNNWILSTDADGLIFKQNDIVRVKILNDGEVRAHDLTGSVNFN